MTYIVEHFDDDDLHRYCHTREGIGHSLQAGEQATSSFV
jgi:hypothetical protein